MTTDQAAAQLTLQPERAGPRRRVRVRGLMILVPCSLVVCLFVVAGLFAPLLEPHDPGRVAVIQRLTPPAWQAGGSHKNLLGTDQLGRDELSRLLYGARISLTVVATTIPLSAAVGTLVGTMAAWRGGKLDKLLMRLVDVQLALPAILFAILLAAVFGPSLRNVIILIIIWSWSGYARIVRGDVLSIRERDFILSARAVGAGQVRIIARHILPNLVNTVVVLATLEIASVILIEASLSFLGVGVPLGTASWGAMISDGRSYITIAWWPVTIPGVAILLVSMAGNLLGDWVRDTYDPRLRHAR